jgi:ubiquinone/menaquinone biosynthesis C-methylase UbiE
MRESPESLESRRKLFKRFGYDIRKSRNDLLEIAGSPGKRILEVGTGKGSLAMVMAQKGLRFVSVDLDKEAQKLAAACLKQAGLRRFAAFRVMDAERLNFRSGAFDGVIPADFFHHAKNPVRCLREMARVARRKLVLADLNQRGMRIMDKVHKAEGHRHPSSRLSMKAIKAFLKKHHWRVKTYRSPCHDIVAAHKD